MFLWGFVTMIFAVFIFLRIVTTIQMASNPLFGAYESSTWFMLWTELDSCLSQIESRDTLKLLDSLDNRVFNPIFYSAMRLDGGTRKSWSVLWCYQELPSSTICHGCYLRPLYFECILLFILQYLSYWGDDETFFRLPAPVCLLQQCMAVGAVHFFIDTSVSLLVFFIIYELVV